MSDWHPVTQPPSEVGRYELADKNGMRIPVDVQWDGRHFRSIFSGAVLPMLKGDVWRLPDRKDSGDAGQ